MHPALERSLQENQEEMLSFLTQLVNIATVNPPGQNYRQCATFLHSALTKLGFKSKILEVPPSEALKALPEAADYPRYNVFGFLDLGAPQTIHYNAHYDVVPVSSGWTHPPFSGFCKDGNIFGRGAADMKGAIAAFIHSLKAFQRARLQPGSNVEVSFVCDEETGGRLGAGYIAENKLPQADFVIVGEGAGGHRVGVGHNGVIWLEVKIKGRAAHASTPDNGLNAFAIMAELAVDLQLFGDKLNKIEFHPPDGKIMRPTLNLGGTFGQGEGAKINTVPENAWFTIDRRVLPNENCDVAERELCQRIQSFAEKNSKFEFEIKRLFFAQPYLISENHPLPKSFAQAIQAIYPDKVEYSVSTGFNDSRFFGLDLKIPTIGYGPLGSNHHAANEHTTTKNLHRTSQVYTTFLETSL